MRTSLPDHETELWLVELGGIGIVREDAIGRLHRLLVRVARSEVARRSGTIPVIGPELDDIAHHAAADALLAITGKLGEFRRESRFTTWACKFMMFEVSAKLGRHFWRQSTVALNAEDWERLPDRFGLDPAAEAQWHDLLTALRAAVDTELTDRQRRMFVALVLAGVPLDALAAQLGSTRGAIYKTLYEARRKLRASLAPAGTCPAGGSGRSDEHREPRAVPRNRPARRRLRRDVRAARPLRRSAHRR